jgi:hypothetical protein
LAASPRSHRANAKRAIAEIIADMCLTARFFALLFGGTV